MKFLIEFSQSNLYKFRQFIKLCSRTFGKTGIIMTIIKDSIIRVAPDPFSISDKFDIVNFETSAMEIYKSFSFIEYPLISSNDQPKNFTYDKLELIVRSKKIENNNNQHNPNECMVTFRIAKEELIDLNNLLNNSFISSSELTIKATNKPDFLKKTGAQNYTSAYLSIFDKSKNSIKSGILCKPLKQPIEIYDYEDQMLNSGINSNNNLGEHLYSSQIRSKFLKKFCMMASNNMNKSIIMYTFKERDPKEKFNKNHLIISYLNNCFCLGCFIYNQNDDPNNMAYLEEFKKIYKITLNSEIIIRLLKNFQSAPTNPDYISVYTKSIVMKTSYVMENNMYENEQNIKNDGDENLFEQEQEENSDNEQIEISITLKSLIYYPNNIEVIEYDEKEDENQMSKKEYVLSLIDENIDDKHEELNKSFDYSLDDIGGKDFGIGDNNLFDEDEEIEKENDIKEKNDILRDEERSEDEKDIKKKKKKKAKMPKKQKKPKRKKEKSENENDEND